MSETQENIAAETTAEEAANVGAGETAPACPPPSPQIQAQPETLGQALRAGREAARLSVEDVAQSVKFSVRQVEAIEADDYAALPGNTIVRGFARSYGRLLKIEEGVLLGLLNTALPNAPTEVRTPDNMGDATEPQGLQKLPWLASLAIVILLATILIALWHFLVPSSPKPPVTSALTTQRAPDAAPVASEQPVPPVAPATGAATGESSAAPPAAVATEVATEVPGAGATLVFVFGNRSWLEVTDANRQLVHTGENPAGTQLSLKGKPPFDIVIGNAGQVKLSMNGRDIDLAPYTRADVARFKLAE